MSRLIVLFCAFSFAALSALPLAAWAQSADAGDVDLRGADPADDVGGFPTSPSQAPLTIPDDNSPPASPPVSQAPPQDERPRTDTDTDPTNPNGTDNLPAVEPNNTAPNYGKPRKPKAKLFRPNPKIARPLSPLVPYRTAPLAPGQKRPLNFEPPPKDAIDPPAPAPTVAVIPAPPRPKRIVPDADPFAPVGIEAGSLVLKPFVETSTGYETNPNQVSTQIKPSSVFRVDGGVDATADQSWQFLTASLRGGYSEFPSNSNANRPDLSATIDDRFDVTRLDRIDTEARFTLATQTPGSPLLAVPNSVFIVNRPLITSEGATLGETHLFGPLSVSLKGTFDRTQYADALQSNGTTFQYSLENYNDYGVVARVSYEPTASIIPFAEFGFDSRVHDSLVDVSGYERNSLGGTARAGATVDLLGYLTGNASAGYLERHYEDPRLTNLSGPTVDASLVYAMTPLTTVTARASTTASETTLAGASGAISRSFSGEIDHVFFRHFTLSGIATYQPNTYQGVSGNERYLTLTLKGAYNISREIQLIASVSREKLNSTFVGEGFSDNIFLAGVRLQR